MTLSFALSLIRSFAIGLLVGTVVQLIWYRFRALKAKREDLK